MLHNVILIIHVLIAISLIGLVLIQQGKGADMGAAFGSGASSTVFGSQGSASFLTRLTGVLAALFFVTSLTLAFLVTSTTKPKSALDSLPESAPVVIEQPIAPKSETVIPSTSTTEKPQPIITPTEKSDK